MYQYYVSSAGRLDAEKEQMDGIELAREENSIMLVKLSDHVHDQTRFCIVATSST